MGSKTLHLIVSCTKRKSLEVPTELQMRRFTQKNIRTKLNRWVKAIDSSPSISLRAFDLYIGDHWSVVRDIYKHAGLLNNVKLHVWVCSAGYGLVNIEAKLKPYSATFSSGDIDSIEVSSESNDRETWWDGFASSDISGINSPRSIRELMKNASSDTFLFCLSDSYLRSVGKDLTLGINSGIEPENILILSTGHKGTGILGTHQIPSSSTLTKHLGGSLNSLNTRVARMMIMDASKYPLVLGVQKKRMSSLLKTLRPVVKLNRTRLSDAEVIGFIKKELNLEDNASNSKLLRRLRDSGLACEQSRFSNLYRYVKKEILNPK